MRVAEGLMIKRLPRYFDMLVGSMVETLEEFKNKEWEELKKVLKKEYRAGDSIQQINSRAFLEAYKSKERTSKDNVQNYCRKFSSIAAHLMAQNRLDAYTRLQWFMQGLPDKLCEELCFRKDIALDDDDLDDFNKVVQKTLKHVETQKRYKELRRVDHNTSARYGALTDQFDRRIQLASHTEIAKVLKPPVAPPAMGSGDVSEKFIELN